MYHMCDSAGIGGKPLGQSVPADVFQIFFIPQIEPFICFPDMVHNDNILNPHII